jgi:hypothetical protein
LSITDELRNIDAQLSSNFKRLLLASIFMLLVTVIGGAIAFLVSYEVGYLIAAVGIILGSVSILSCAVLRFLGKHQKVNNNH